MGVERRARVRVGVGNDNRDGASASNRTYPFSFSRLTRCTGFDQNGGFGYVVDIEYLARPNDKFRLEVRRK